MSKTNPKSDPQRANVNNPNNDAYWISMGYSKRPKNWKQLASCLKDSTSSKNRTWKHIPADGGYDFPLCKDDYRAIR